MKDIIKPIENPELVQAMTEFQNNPIQNSERKFIKCLLTSNFLIPIIKDTRFPKQFGKVQLETNLKMEIQTLQNEQGERFIPVFTDWNELGKGNFNKTIDGLIFTYEDCEKAIAHNIEWLGIVINPYTQNIVLNRKDFEHIKNVFNSSRPSESLIIGEPKKYPTQLVVNLSKMFDKMKEIKKAYFLLMVRNKVDKSYLLVIDIEGNSNNFSRK